MADSRFEQRKDKLLDRLVAGEITRDEYDELLSRLERDTSKSSRGDTPHYGSIGDQPTRAAGRDVLWSGFQLDEFVLAERVGRGGMGEVWKSRDTIGSRDVVIKVLPPELSDNPDEIARVQDSFQRVHALNHERICPTYALRRHSQVGYYLVMQCLDATTLGAYRRKIVANKGEFPLSEIVRLLSQVATALDYAHSRKVIHRDIKPENIMVSRDGKEVWVIDFGLAAEIQSSLTRVSKVQMDRSGTYPYMAPEQWRGQYQDAKTDQYALAIVAYELLAGRLPFDGDPFILQGCALNEPLPTIANASQAVNQALSKATAKIREERFASCSKFVTSIAFIKAISEVAAIPSSNAHEDDALATTSTERTNETRSPAMPARPDTCRRQRSLPPRIPVTNFCRSLTAYADPSARFAACVIDWALVTFFVLLMLDILRPRMDRIEADREVIRFASHFGVIWMYYAFMESSRWQATLGKMAARLKVTSVEGRRITLMQALIRRVALFLPGLPFFSGLIVFAPSDRNLLLLAGCSASVLTGFVLIRTSPRAQAFHDRIAGCVVVRRS